MAEFKTPVKTQTSLKPDDKIVIPPSPFLNRLGYGTGIRFLTSYSETVIRLRCLTYKYVI